VAAQTSHISAHELTATVAPFRAWRSLQLIIARGPERATIAKRGRLFPFYWGFATPVEAHISSPSVAAVILLYVTSTHVPQFKM